ncbi:MAG: GNAT family N-acetyltransferase [Cytophagaceae bacterium]|nr:MAG: GNAT family N-acetyltransferase [Cytophagaceae bacterium]
MNADFYPKTPNAIIRNARCHDALAVAGLLATLGYPSLVEDVEQRIADCEDSVHTIVFVAESDSHIVGALSFHCIPLFHAEGYLGRITSLIVAPDYRQRGIGRLLVFAAEQFAWSRRCIRVEVTSGDHRSETHAFYEHLGYQLDCRRFIKHDRNV